MIATLRRKAATVRGVVRRHGPWRAAGHVASVTLWALRLGRGGLIVTLPAGRPPAAPSLTPSEGEAMLASRDDLLAFAESLTNTSALDASWVDERLACGDHCVVLRRDGIIVAYHWFASGPLRLFGTQWLPGPGFLMHHRIWVETALRGQHIAERLFTTALALVPLPETPGIVGLVEFANYASRAALARMGLTPAGFVVQIGPDAWRCAVSRMRGQPLLHADRLGR